MVKRLSVIIVADYDRKGLIEYSGALTLGT